MKILFVCSGNSSTFDVIPFIGSQANSLIELGHTVDIYRVVGKGFFGYLHSLRPLSRRIRANQYNVIHSHYSLCAIIATCAIMLNRFSVVMDKRKRSKAPLIVSLMGSDVNSNLLWLLLIRMFSVFWHSVIVKSHDMKSKLRLKRVSVIPNGVNIGIFKELDPLASRSELEFKPEVAYILFGADPQRKEKNYPLAQAACKKLSQPHRLITLGNIPHEKIPLYLNACDVLLLTSFWEGSPNIVKEAMGCNCPVVSTEVGDVKWLLQDVNGSYIAKADPMDLAQKLSYALAGKHKTNGRDRLLELHLDSVSVANQLVDIYKKALAV